MRLITVDEAFSDENVDFIEEALFALNTRGVVDKNFIPLVETFLHSWEAKANFAGVSTQWIV